MSLKRKLMGSVRKQGFAGFKDCIKNVMERKERLNPPLIGSKS